jgi:hypothetical protein
VRETLVKKYAAATNANPAPKVHRHRHGIASGLAKSRRKDFNYPKGQSDRRHLAQIVLGIFAHLNFIPLLISHLQGPELAQNATMRQARGHDWPEPLKLCQP